MRGSRLFAGSIFLREENRRTRVTWLKRGEVGRCPKLDAPKRRATHYQDHPLWDRFLFQCPVGHPHRSCCHRALDETLGNQLWADAQKFHLDPNWTSWIQTSYFGCWILGVGVEYSRISIRSFNSSSIRWSLFHAGAQSCCISCMIIEWFSTT